MASRLLTILVSLFLAMALVGCGEDVPASVQAQANLVRSGAANRLAFSSPSDFLIYTESLMWLSEDSVVGDKATKYLAEVYSECSPGGRVVINMGTLSPDGKSIVPTGTAQDPDFFDGLKVFLLKKLYDPTGAEFTRGTYIKGMHPRIALFLKLNPGPSGDPNDPWFGTASRRGLYPNTN